MKEKTIWREPIDFGEAMNVWAFKSSGLVDQVYFSSGADIRWVSFYLEVLGNSMGQRAGKIIGDE